MLCHCPCVVKNWEKVKHMKENYHPDYKKQLAEARRYWDQESASFDQQLDHALRGAWSQMAGSVSFQSLACLAEPAIGA